nr:hypothetical protein BaRGS_031350 [Batillaria attramentaria]
MFSLVMAAAYSGTLTAFLSVTKDTQPFTSLQDLVTKQHDYKWGTYGRGGIALTLQNGREAVYQEVWAGMQRFAAEDSDVLSENTTKLAEKVRSENFVLFFYERPAQTIFAEDCRVVTVDAGMRQTLASLVLPKGSALTRPTSDV